MRVRTALMTSLALCLTCQAKAEDPPGAATSATISAIKFERSLNGAAQSAQISPNSVSLSSGPKTDFFRATDGVTAYSNAPVLLTAIDNAKPFTFVARVKPVLIDSYDAGALYLWVREDNWLKMAFERDERALSRIVTVRTIGTSDDNNHDVVSAEAAYLKISSDTKSIGFYYSIDAKSWQLVRVFRNDYPPRLWLGLSAQSPLGQGNTVQFDTLSLTQTSVADFRKGE